jgi:cation:H+ antiporter
MWLPILVLIFGFIMLVWSADRFVSGAAAAANNLGVSKMLIGLTVVSLGTSAPEILVALTASLDGLPMLAIGNAIGSNIANIGLVLGITALIRQLPFAPSVLKGELPWLMGTTVIALFCLADFRLDMIDGIILLSGLGYILFRLTRVPLGTPEGFVDTFEEELDELPEMQTPRALLWLGTGLIVLLGSAQALVWAASVIAGYLGVSELVIGLTVVAVGTSLPELAATVGSAIKGHPDIAIGNVVGSNILNILAVLAVPALVSPTNLESVVLWRDFGMMFALTMLLVLFAYGIGSRAIITRFEGTVLLLAWVGYNYVLYHQA